MGVVAVMQPYLFPYIGYYQLVAATDEFVFYDDAQYMNDGWINRNRTPDGWFTVPVAADALETPIRGRRVAPLPYARFRRKWLKRFALRYRGAPHYAAAARLVEEVFTTEPHSISQMAERSVSATAAYLGLDRPFRRSSELTYDRTLPREEKLLSLLATRDADGYVNPVGGRHLYGGESFSARGIDLRFLRSTLDYTAEAPGFGYSILHLLAHHSPEDCHEWLSHYTLTPPRPDESPNHRPAEDRHIR
ncbi:WbqC family protein [Lewinella sp. IMCC34183]|uniref:WbqC family protein n=1 Tax=Lewinella sp. IMCC34183 TaxID=2248762 RepID=UPI000E25CA2F|nr:WbqC family protein [Lewinella sp. IMCC34183]